MSTILDALRKVQRERDRESPDLRQALAQEESARAGGFGPGHWAVVAGLVLLAVGVSAYLFVGGDRPGEPIGSQAAAAGPAGSSGPDGAEVAAAPQGHDLDLRVDPEQLRREAIRGAVNERLDSLSRGKPRKAPPPRGPKPAPQSTASTEGPEAEALGLSAAARARIAQAIVARNSPPASDPMVPAPQETQSEPAPTHTLQPMPTPAPVPVAPRAKVPPPPVSEPEPERAAAATRPPEPPPVRELEPLASTPDSGSIVSSDPWEERFPDLRLEAVRWHPDSTRREVRLLVDATRSVFAREGDVVVGGVAVHRIDPGAVELRLGDSSRLIRIGQ